MPVPNWLLTKIGTKRYLSEIPRILKEAKLHTVCQEARCPNIGECFERGTATFLILGNLCTRDCRFCGVKKAAGSLLSLDRNEPERVARAVKRLGLRHVVVTSVTRDDLPEGGAEHFAQTIREVRKLTPEVSIEVLIPDFSGNPEALKLVIKEKPEVINHNLEVVERLYPNFRPQADYRRSLSVIRKIKELAPEIFSKSGLMLGVGEEEKEVLAALKDLRKAGGEILTLGQYFQPTGRQLAVRKYLAPEEFASFQRQAESLGFLFTAAGSFIRSSYRAREAYEKVRERKRNGKIADL